MIHSDAIIACFKKQIETVDIGGASSAIEVLHKRIQAPIFHCTFTAPEDFVTMSDASIAFTEEEKEICDECLCSEGMLIAPSDHGVGEDGDTDNTCVWGSCVLEGAVMHCLKGITKAKHKNCLYCHVFQHESSFYNSFIPFGGTNNHLRFAVRSKNPVMATKIVACPLDIFK